MAPSSVLFYWVLIFCFVFSLSFSPLVFLSTHLHACVRVYMCVCAFIISSTSRASNHILTSCQPYRVHHHRHYLSCQLAYRAATKLLHPCLSLASLWRVPQLWFMFFISASTVLHRVVSTLPLSLWSPVDCNFGDGVGIHVQHVLDPAPSLSGDGGLHILLLALC